MKTLIITEKPSVAVDISTALPEKFSRQEGCLEGDSMIITWALGHLLEPSMPQDYDPTLERWAMDTLPILPEDFRLKPRPDTVKQLKTIQTLLKRRDVDMLINACDAGREGELIFRNIILYLDSRKPHKRLWLSETTPAAIQAAFSRLRPEKDFENLAQAAAARSQADWIVGINATRGFSVQNRDKLTVGRVQTPTLALLVKRERDIENFVPVPYWELEAEFNPGAQSYRGKWFQGKQDRFMERGQAQAILEQLNPGNAALVSSVEQKENRELPPQLFNLNELQKEANKKWGFTAEETLNLTQKLYEAHLLTYPRTDSRHLTSSMAATLPARLRSLQHTELAEVAASVKPGLKDKRYVDDTKVSDHTAIIITDTTPALERMPVNERQLYLLVARRLLGVFLPPARFLQTSVVTSLQGETFLTRGKLMLEAGWKILYLSEREEDDETMLPPLEPGQEVVFMQAEILNKETQSAKRYSEATLLAAMENAGRQVEDEELREAMRGKGLGTPATRAAIIEKLIDTGYVLRQKKNLIPTDKGKFLIDVVTPELKDPEMTGEWEKKLSDIEQGQYEQQAFLEAIREFTRSMISKIKQQAAEAAPPVSLPVGAQILGTCPLCGQPVLESMKGYGCSAWREGCKFVIWKNIAGKNISLTNAKRILTQGSSNLIKGFKSKKGSKFDAYLKLEDGQVVFDFSRENGK